MDSERSLAKNFDAHLPDSTYGGLSSTTNRFWESNICKKTVHVEFVCFGGYDFGHEMGRHSSLCMASY